LSYPTYFDKSTIFNYTQKTTNRKFALKLRNVLYTLTQSWNPSPSLNLQNRYTNMDKKVGYGIIVTQEIWLQTADYANNSLLLESLVVKSQNVVVLFVNITIIGTCSRTGDMYFIHTCTWISNVICLVLFVSSEVMWEVIVNFVDIGGIGDYHSLNFLYLITNVECTMREAITTVSHSGNMQRLCHALKRQLTRSVNETTKLFQTKLQLKHWFVCNVNNDVSFIWVILHMSISFGCLRGVNTELSAIALPEV
jgi:hypothetical protein